LRPDLRRGWNNIMVQFNLLPDIKIQYLKTKRQKHLFVLISSIVIAVSIVFLVIVGTVVKVLQVKNIDDLSKDIKTSSKELQGTKDLSKILTVQNQLKSITSIHDQKVVSSRLFTFVTQTTPDKVTIAKISIDYAVNTIIISGDADTLSTVNKYTDTLKFTTFAAGESQVAKPAFTEVVLSSFGRDDKTASYTVTFKFDPALFSGSAEAKLTVPKVTTTRSEIEQPTVLFQNNGQEQ
jgi:hypothetical protein